MPRYIVTKQAPADIYEASVAEGDRLTLTVAQAEIHVLKGHLVADPGKPEARDSAAADAKQVRAGRGKRN